MAGKRPVGVICELVGDGEEVDEGVAERRGGGMMRRDACLGFGRTWGLRVCTIEDLVRFVQKREGGDLLKRDGGGGGQVVANGKP